MDCFERISDVSTDLLYGDLSIVSAPWISVIVPTFSRQVYLREALLSLLKQGTVHFAWEIVVVDNTPLDEHGTAPALELVRQLGNKRILYYHNRVNIGSGYNWNRGVELARGEWVSFLHDDDVVCPDALSQLERIIRTYRGCSKPLGYIHANRSQFADTYDPMDAARRKRPVCIELTQLGALIRGDTLTGVPSCGTTILKKAYMEAGGINYSFGPTADAILGYQIMANYTVLRSDIILGGYRWSQNATLNRDTLIALVKSDGLFAEYRYGKTAFSRLWGHLFGDVQSVDNMYSKISAGETGHITLTLSDFAYQDSHFCFTLRKVLHRLIRFGYQCAVFAKAFWFSGYFRLKRKNDWIADNAIEIGENNYDV